MPRSDTKMSEPQHVFQGPAHCQGAEASVRHCHSVGKGLSGDLYTYASVRPRGKSQEGL